MSRKELAEWLSKLEDERGRLTPEQVVDAARDPDSPGHPFFDWDDSVAAQKWRICQARDILSVRVVIRTAEAVYKTPLYVHDPTVPAGQQMYVATTRARTEEDVRRDVMRSEMDRLEAILERIAGLACYFDAEEDVRIISDHARRMQLKIAQAPAMVQ